MKVLVCGGAGYIGSHMCKVLSEAGHDVTVFDNLSTGHADAVRWGRFIQGDLLSVEDIEKAFADSHFEAVMHFCARSLVGESMTRPDLYYQNNVGGTLNLLDAMVRHKVNRFIFSSTAAVYGNPEYTPIDERHPTAPINPYGRTKLMAEALFSDYDRAFGIKSVSLRYFNAAGADPGGMLGEHHEPETHLIPNILLSVRKGSSHPLKVFGNNYPTPDGTCVRDYIHVLDICDAHLRALQYLADQDRSNIFNLGNGTGFSVMEVIHCAEKVTGREIPYSIDSARPGDPPVLVASSVKAREVLSWAPRFAELDAIIKTAWSWHQNN